MVYSVTELVLYLGKCAERYTLHYLTQQHLKKYANCKILRQYLKFTTNL